MKAKLKITDDTSKIERLRGRDDTNSTGVLTFCERVIDRMMSKTQHLSDLDALVGDGDLGSNLEKVNHSPGQHIDRLTTTGWEKN